MSGRNQPAFARQSRDGDTEVRRSEDETAKWHVGREVPLAIIGAILFQTVGIVWWAAGVSGDVRNLGARMSALETRLEQTVKTVSDSAAPAAVIGVRLELLSVQVGALRDQIEASRRGTGK